MRIRGSEGKGLVWDTWKQRMNQGLWVRLGKLGGWGGAAAGAGLRVSRIWGL